MHTAAYYKRIITLILLTPNVTRDGCPPTYKGPLKLLKLIAGNLGLDMETAWPLIERESCVPPRPSPRNSTVYHVLGWS